MKKEVTYAEFLANLPTEQRQELDKLSIKVTKQVAEGTKTSVAAGETLLAVRNLLAKAGSGGQFTGYCNAHNIVRQTAYNYIRAFQWTKVSDPYKQMLTEKFPKLALDEVTQNVVIKMALQAIPATVTEVQEKLAFRKPPSADPLKDAIERAGEIILRAYAGDLDSFAALANVPKYATMASEEATAIHASAVTTLARLGQVFSKGLIEGSKERKVPERFISGLAALRLPEVTELQLPPQPTA